MKKLQLLTLALIVTSIGMFASNKETVPVAKKEIRSQIVQLLHTPNFAVENDLTVNLTFTFSTEGEIVVLNVDSTNSDVLKYVRENLNYKKIEAPGAFDKHYTMPLKLKSI